MFRFVLEVKPSTGFAHELVIGCYWREREESKMTSSSADAVEVSTSKQIRNLNAFVPSF